MRLDVPALGDFHVSHISLLLYVEQRHVVAVTQEEHTRSSVEYLVAIGSCYLLGDLIFQVLDDQLEEYDVRLVSLKALELCR